MSEEFALEIKQDYEQAKCLYEKIKKTCYLIIATLGLAIIGLISSYIVTGERVKQHSRDIGTIKENYVDRWTMLLLIQSIDAHTEEIRGIKNGDIEKINDAQKQWKLLREQMIQGTHYTTRGDR